MRELIVDTINAWLGVVQGSVRHQEIIGIYNKAIQSGKYPESSKYQMKASDAWCAATVSATFISAGLGHLFPCVECSCGRMINIARNHGIWVENDAYKPKIGDAIIYDWNDDGIGDDVTGHNHVGIVTSVGSGYFTVTEGNMLKNGKSVVGQRNMEVNGRYIRGFVTPKYERVHIVKPGENLTKIAETYNTSVGRIIMLNPNIKNPDIIYVGQRIKVD